jgi:hypothetical protein
VATLTYGAETQTGTNTDISSLIGAEIRFLRNAEGNNRDETTAD